MGNADTTAAKALDALKGRRRSRSSVPTPAVDPVTSSDQIITRRNPLLFDPAEMPVVVESGGFVPAAVLDANYVIAQLPAYRQVIPDGCRTPVAQILWTAGQRVRRDAYEAYQKDHVVDVELPGIVEGERA